MAGEAGIPDAPDTRSGLIPLSSENEREKVGRILSEHDGYILTPGFQTGRALLGGLRGRCIENKGIRGTANLGKNKNTLARVRKHGWKRNCFKGYHNNISYDRHPSTEFGLI